jgi:endonuclease/exonuclease/phosphatase (EEP) superfamily protein YafD
MRAWHRAIAAGVAIAGGMLGCSEAVSPPGRPVSPGDFTLATFNVYFPAADDVETAAAVGDTAADVLLLQEISPRWKEVLEQRYGGIYPHRLYMPAGGAGGLAVLSRFPLRDQGLLAPVIKHPAWLVGVHTPAGDLNVLNVHLRASTRPGQNLLAGLLGMSSDHEREIREFLAACRLEPQVIAGDFNEGPRGGAVEWLTQRGYVDVLEMQRPGTPTFRALGGLYKATLDHVLLLGGVSAVDAKVLRRGQSDHWPLVVRLRKADSATP